MKSLIIGRGQDGKPICSKNNHPKDRVNGTGKLLLKINEKGMKEDNRKDNEKLKKISTIEEFGFC